MLRLINEILDLAMIESGKVTMSAEPMSMAEVLVDCHELVSPQALGHGIELVFPGSCGAAYVHADRTRVKQVLINLLSNAIKYNRRDGTVTVTCAPGAEAMLRVTVADTGAGLTPEQLSQLFQPFNRLGQENGIEEGTGIGLVVTRQLVELMGGQIGVDSEPGRGSRFWFELPLCEAPAVEGLSDINLESLARAIPLSSPVLRTLLYVEDNPANLLLVEELVSRRSDLKLLTAIDAHLGIALARAYAPALILMDINLPGLSGFGALRVLRKDPKTRHIPVLALSANAVPRDIEKGMQAGFFRYLTKPIKIAEFMDAIDLALLHAEQTGRPEDEMPATQA